MSPFQRREAQTLSTPSLEALTQAETAGERPPAHASLARLRLAASAGLFNNSAGRPHQLSVSQAVPRGLCLACSPGCEKECSQESARDFHGKVYPKFPSTRLWALETTGPAAGLNPTVPEANPRSSAACQVVTSRMSPTCLSLTISCALGTAISSSYKHRSQGAERLSVWPEVTQQSPASIPCSLTPEEASVPAMWYLTC